MLTLTRRKTVKMVVFLVLCFTPPLRGVKHKTKTTAKLGFWQSGKGCKTELAKVDIESIKGSHDLRDVASSYTTLKRESSTEMSGPCPKCGGVNRFHCRADWFFCRQCYPPDNRQPHDVIGFLQWIEGLTFPEACKALGGSLPIKHNRQKRKKIVLPLGLEPPPADWQERAWHIVDDFADALWDQPDVLDWLHNRGLADETLRAWQIGFCPAEGEYHDIFCRKGVAIAWVIGDILWGINIRRGQRPKGAPKYEMAKGSKRALFGTPGWAGKVDCLVVEGEFDALLLWQEARELADVLALGSASAKVADRWLPLLLPYERFWILTDKDDAGDKAAAYWLSLTGKRGHRLLPPAGRDVGEAWQNGVDLRGWLGAVLGQFV